MTQPDEHVLAAYVDGFDLESVASAIRRTLERFAVSNSWPSSAVRLVDQRSPFDPAEPDFLPQWDLGINLGLDHIPRTPDWFAGVASLIGMMQQLASETGREFVLFLCFTNQPWRQEHLLLLDAAPVDHEWLRKAILRLVETRI